MKHEKNKIQNTMLVKFEKSIKKLCGRKLVTKFNDETVMLFWSGINEKLINICCKYENIIVRIYAHK